MNNIRKYRNRIAAAIVVVVSGIAASHLLERIAGSILNPIATLQMEDSSEAYIRYQMLSDVVGSSVAVVLAVTFFVSLAILYKPMKEFSKSLSNKGKEE